MNQPENGILPERAIVTPRGFREGSEAALPLEELIRPHIGSGDSGAIFISGPTGSGKTTALSHLKSVFQEAGPITFFDEPLFHHWVNHARDGLAIVAFSGKSPIEARRAFQMAPWSQDDLIEYLVHLHRGRCASVMKRLAEDINLDDLGGSPRLLRIVLDQMATHEDILTAADAMRQYLEETLPDDDGLRLTIAYCVARECPHAGLGAEPSPVLVSDALRSLLRFQYVRTILAAIGITEQLCSLGARSPMHAIFEAALIREIAHNVVRAPAAAESLQRMIEDPKNKGHAMAASILLRVDSGWCPPPTTGLQLNRALLRGAKWNRLVLTKAHLHDADLTEASLNHAVISGAMARGARFIRTELRSATAERAQLVNPDFSNADMEHASLPNARIERGVFRGARLSHANLTRAYLLSGSFENADATHADFSGAMMISCEVEDADFSHAKFCGAILDRIHMHKANWRYANFSRVNLKQCDLCGLSMPQADFERSNLTGCDLTGTQIPGGNFRGAFLRDAGLADIEWENADLREADFTNASFHMGSTRSGLVGSLIPCEGSKTGFYTDEFNEQDFKAPEEIRKANLCGANLLGAKVTGTDWYLVDLRGATYSQEQAEHFARCGAILRARVS